MISCQYFLISDSSLSVSGEAKQIMSSSIPAVVGPPLNGLLWIHIATNVIAPKNPGLVPIQEGPRGKHPARSSQCRDDLVDPDEVDDAGSNAEEWWLRRLKTRLVDPDCPIEVFCLV